MSFTRHSFVVPVMAVVVLLGAGCGNKNARQVEVRSFVPPAAQLVAGGKPPLSHLVTRAGVIYVVNERTDTLVHSSDVTADTLVTVDPEARAVQVSGPGIGPRTLVTQLDRSHRYSMWFAAANSDRARRRGTGAEGFGERDGPPAPTPPPRYPHESGRQPDGGQ